MEHTAGVAVLTGQAVSVCLRGLATNRGGSIHGGHQYHHLWMPSSRMAQRTNDAASRKKEVADWVLENSTDRKQVFLENEGPK